MKDVMRAGEVPFARSDAFAAACGMPTGISDSEAEAWLIAQPEIREWVFEQFRMSGALVLDSVKNTLSGNSSAVLFGSSPASDPAHSRGERVRNDRDRIENEMRIKAFIACITLPASVDYEMLESLIQRELDALGVGHFRLDCELAEIGIEILDELRYHDVFVDTNINLVCPLAYRYAQILCDEHWWAAESDPLDFHDLLTSIISTGLKKFKTEQRTLLAGVLLEELEPRCGHWRGFREKIVAVAGHNRAEEMIILARAELIAAWDQLEKEGMPNYEDIPKAGPHFE
jgi:hypothetical protein